LTDGGGDRGAERVPGEVVGHRDGACHGAGTPKPGGVALSNPRDRRHRGCSATYRTDRRPRTRQGRDYGGHTSRVSGSCRIVGEVVGDGNGTGDGVSSHAADAVALAQAHACRACRAPTTRGDHQPEGYGQGDHQTGRHDAKLGAEAREMCQQSYPSVMDERWSNPGQEERATLPPKLWTGAMVWGETPGTPTIPHASAQSRRVTLPGPWPAVPVALWAVRTSSAHDQRTDA
jgi:hypothetical protein